MANTFYLDLHSNQLFGWEKEKRRDSLDSIIDGINHGAIFPAVPVYRTNDGRFFLAIDIETIEGSGIKDGGHRRSLAHYLKRKPLRCNLLPGRPPYLLDKGLYIPIRDIHLV